MPESINLTPSWETAAMLYAEVVANSQTPEGREEAKAEIKKVGRLLDEAIAEYNTLLEKHTKLVEAF